MQVLSTQVNSEMNFHVGRYVETTAFPVPHGIATHHCSHSLWKTLLFQIKYHMQFKLQFQVKNTSLQILLWWKSNILNN